jgi:hypothetical protein
VVGVSITNKFKQEAGELGRIALSTKYPNEFEVYIMSLELTDSDGRTVDYFSFPVMPTHISKPENKRVKTKTSSSGVTVLSSDAHTPSEILIKGDFGRSFKLMIKPQLGDVEGYGFKGFFNNLQINTPTFDIGVKTGFGCIKILQDIIGKSVMLDSKGKPYRLYLYNMALAESYLVVTTPQGLILTQSYDKNMIWTYSLSLTILAPLNKINPEKAKFSSSKLLQASIVQNFANRIGSEIKNLL